MAEKVLSRIIDQSNISIEEMREIYEGTLAEKYGDSLDSVLEKIAPIDRPMAALQLTNEMLQKETLRRTSAEAQADEKRREAEVAERSLKEVEQYRKKMALKQERGQVKARKQKAKSKSRRGKRK
jgi:hypothetical protein